MSDEQKIEEEDEHEEYVGYNEPDHTQQIHLRQGDTDEEGVCFTSSPTAN